MVQKVLFREKDGSTGREVVFVKTDQNRIVKFDSLVLSLGKYAPFLAVRKFFWSVLLPQGYPDSVSSDYASYQVWDTIQAFASTMTGTLTTQAIMQGVGVGDTAATPLAAAVTWILKDGAGNIGRVTFTWWIGTRLDADCKTWRLFADVINDVAMFLELLLPKFLGFSTTILCVSTILKSIVGVAGGATRAAITQHQAVRDNMADVSAKDGSQETCVNLLASVFGLLLLSAVGTFAGSEWILFFLFTALHLYSNYQAVRSLRFQTLNRTRLKLVIEDYLTNEHIPSVKAVNKMEPIILGCTLSDETFCGFKIKFGSSLQKVIPFISANELQLMINLSQKRSYLLVPTPKYEIYIALSQDSQSNSLEMVIAYFHAVVLGLAINIGTSKNKLPWDPNTQHYSPLQNLYKRLEKCTKYSSGEKFDRKFPIEAILAADDFVSEISSQFVEKLLSQGWSANGHVLGSSEWRGSWSSSECRQNSED